MTQPNDLIICKDESPTKISSNNLLPGEYEWLDPKSEDEVHAYHSCHSLKLLFMSFPYNYL